MDYYLLESLLKDFPVLKADDRTLPLSCQTLRVSPGKVVKLYKIGRVSMSGKVILTRPDNGDQVRVLFKDLITPYHFSLRQRFRFVIDHLVPEALYNYGMANN